MSHEGTLTLLGILVLLTPFLGLPYSWLMVILPIFGLAVMALSILLRARGMSRVPVEHAEAVTTPSFDETTSAIV